MGRRHIKDYYMIRGISAIINNKTAIILAKYLKPRRIVINNGLLINIIELSWLVDLILQLHQ